MSSWQMTYRKGAAPAVGGEAERTKLKREIYYERGRRKELAQGEQAGCV